MPPSSTNGIITQYQVNYSSDSGDNFMLQSTTNNGLTYTVTGLDSNTTYEFQLRAFTVVGSGPSSNGVIACTCKLLCILVL